MHYYRRKFRQRSAIMMFDLVVILILLGVVLSGINGASLQACHIAIRDIPHHYVREFDDYCFEFVNIERTWGDARKDCKARGGDLVEVANENIQNFLYTTLKIDLKWNWNGVWIGATDHDAEKTWMWVRTEQKVTWNKWYPGEGPHHRGGFLFAPNAEVEDCAQMRLENGGAWHDYRCDGIGIHYTYVCQYGVTSEVDLKLSINDELPQYLSIDKLNRSWKGLEIPRIWYLT